MGKAIVVYASRSGETYRIANLIAEGIRIQGSEASVVNITKVKKVEDLEGFDAYVFGSATYHGEMIQGMKTMLFLAEKIGLEGKVGGSFGAFGWSGEAPGRIFDTMKNIFKMDMVNGPLMLKSALLNAGVEMGHGYGKDVAQKL